MTFMKSLTFEEFAKLPAGVVFMFQTEVDGQLQDEILHRKGESIADPETEEVVDFFYSYVGPQQTGWQKQGGQVDLDHSESRWAVFDRTHRFLVLDRSDIDLIVKSLLQSYYKTPRDL